MKYVLVGLCILLSACAAGKFLNQSGYETIALGNEVSLIEEEYGPPYEINALPNGDEEWVYINRIETGGGKTDHAQYILRVSRGRVISKRCEVIGQPLQIQTF